MGLERCAVLRCAGLGGPLSGRWLDQDGEGAREEVKVFEASNSLLCNVIAPSIGVRGNGKPFPVHRQLIQKKRHTETTW